MSRHSRTLELGEQASTTELLGGSTHPVSINWPAPWHRRVADPICALPGPVPAAPGSVFPLRSRSPQPFSPFLHGGNGPFGLSALSQEPTEASASQPTDRGGVFTPIARKLLRAAANHRSRRRSGDCRVTNEGCEGKDRCLPTPPVLSALRHAA